MFVLLIHNNSMTNVYDYVLAGVLVRCCQCNGIRALGSGSLNGVGNIFFGLSCMTVWCILYTYKWSILSIFPPALLLLDLVKHAVLDIFVILELCSHS